MVAESGGEPSSLYRGGTETIQTCRITVKCTWSRDTLQQGFITSSVSRKGLETPTQGMISENGSACVHPPYRPTEYFAAFRRSQDELWLE